MNSKKEVQHVYLVGAKSLGAYGGYETFVYKLTEYHQNKENIKYHVACKANGDGCMDESKFEGVTKINDHEFEFHNAHCFKIDVPQIGSAQAIYYDVAALKACCEHIKKNHKCQVILETAMGDEVFANCKDLNCQRNHVIEIMTTGRLVPFKNTMMAVEGVHTLSTKYSNIHMTIIGKGPEKHRILEYIQNNKLETIVEIIPEIPREQLLMRLCDADIYAFPSLREGGSWALMEAMAVGLPVVCLNWTGMRIITDTESAIRIEPSDYENTKSEFTAGIEKLLLDSDLRCSIGTAARDRMMQVFNWTHVGDTIKEIFDQLEEK